MSLEDVKAFYQRLGTDQAFRTQIQGVNSKDECSQIVKSAGYDFTQEELEEYTVQLLELNADEDELADLDEKELATVFGGLVAQQLSPTKPRFIKLLPTQLPFISEVPFSGMQTSYGVVIRPQDFTSQDVIAPTFTPLQENSKEV